MRLQQPHSWLLGGSFLVAAFVLRVPEARADDLNAIRRELTDIDAETQALARLPLRRDRLRSATFVEERLADGELFYRLHDYERASIILTDVTEHYPNHRAYPDALALLGDSLYKNGDYIGAKERYREIINRADDRAFQPYVQRALGRLLNIASRTQDFVGVEDYLTRLDRVPSGQVAAATAYYGAKFIYLQSIPVEEPRISPDAKGENRLLYNVNKDGLERARKQFESVKPGAQLFPQARYFVGVIHTLNGQYPLAIRAFQDVIADRSNKSKAAAHIRELAQLGLGRLYYETVQLQLAADAYKRVSKTSRHFDVALYELAWVYLRMGDSTKAERTLEVLTVAAPRSQYIPDAKVLRGNLLLREGRHNDADKAFSSVKGQFGPIKAEMDRVLTAHEDPQLYFQNLVHENLDSFDADAFLPATAKRWSRPEGTVYRALSTVSQLSQTRRMVRETDELIGRMETVLSAPNLVTVFADSRRIREGTTRTKNRLVLTRKRLIDMEANAVRANSAEIASVRAQRKQLERFLLNMPVTDDDFLARDEQLLSRQSARQRQLSGLEVEVAGLDARIVAMDRFLSDPSSQKRDPEGMNAIRTEISAHKRAVQEYREQIKALRFAVEAEKLHVGVGDARYTREADIRAQYNQLVAREHALLLATGSPAGLQYDPLFRRADAVDSTAENLDQRTDTVVAQRVVDMKQVIEQERTKVEGYRGALASLEGDTELVVGGIVYQNFRHVRNRFHDLVLRSDVGRIDVAWAVREEHRTRVDVLSRERAREIQALDDEFREIMDDRPQDKPSEEEDKGGDQ